jgi:peroxiredoxin
MYRIVAGLLILAVITAGCSQSREEEKSPDQVAALGKPAPSFELQDTNGRIWKLADLRGQVVFVNFWATWCPPCREEMPAMQKLYELMPKDSFKMLTILSNDEPALATAFAAKGGFDFPILIDPGSQVAQAYGITGVPETYIVDKQGILQQKYLGPRAWSEPAAQQMLLSYINR